MMVGQDREAAVKQARANAAIDGKAWVLFLHYKTWHIEKVASFFTRFPDGAVVIHAHPHDPCRGTFSCMKDGRCPHDPVCNN